LSASSFEKIEAPAPLYPESAMSLQQLKEANPEIYKNVGKPWTADHVAKLLADVQKKKSHEQIALLHQRTVRGIVGKLKDIAADYYLHNNLRLKEVEKYTGLSREVIYDAISLREENMPRIEGETEAQVPTQAPPEAEVPAEAKPVETSTYMQFPLTRQHLHTFNRTEANDNVCLKYNLDKLLDAINEHLATKPETRYILKLDLPQPLVPRFIEKIKENCINCDIIVDPLVTYVIIDWS